MEEKLQNEKKVNHKAGIGCVLLILLVIVGVCSQIEEDTNNYINGITPIDVYLNFENSGFTTNHITSEEYGHSWDCRKDFGGIECLANMYSPKSKNKIQSIQASVMVTQPTVKRIEAGRFLLKYIASLPYDSANPNEAINWVDRNYYNNADTIIGNVLFELKVPSNFARMLILSAINEQNTETKP